MTNSFALMNLNGISSDSMSGTRNHATAGSNLSQSPGAKGQFVFQQLLSTLALGSQTKAGGTTRGRAASTSTESLSRLVSGLKPHIGAGSRGLSTGAALAVHAGKSNHTMTKSSGKHNVTTAAKQTKTHAGPHQKKHTQSSGESPSQAPQLGLGPLISTAGSPQNHVALNANDSGTPLQSELAGVGQLAHGVSLGRGAHQVLKPHVAVVRGTLGASQGGAKAAAQQQALMTPGQQGALVSNGGETSPTPAHSGLARQAIASGGTSGVQVSLTQASPGKAGSSQHTGPTEQKFWYSLNQPAPPGANKVGGWNTTKSLAVQNRVLGTYEKLAGKIGTPHKKHMDGASSTAQGALQAGQGSQQVSAQALSTSTNTPVINLQDKQVYQQFASLIQQHAQTGSQTLHVQIHPQGLGSVTISVGQQSQGLAIQVSAANPVTAIWLQQEASQLTQALQSAGVHLANLQVNVSQHQGGGEPEGRSNHKKGPKTPEMGRIRGVVRTAGEGSKVPLPALDMRRSNISLRA